MAWCSTASIAGSRRLILLILWISVIQCRCGGKSHLWRNDITVCFPFVTLGCIQRTPLALGWRFELLLGAPYQDKDVPRYELLPSTVRSSAVACLLLRFCNALSLTEY